MAREGLHIDVRGMVQGVGFRPWVYRRELLTSVERPIVLAQNRRSDPIPEQEAVCV